jgi:hypothetical protein
MAYTAKGLLNTSVADCIVDLPRVIDIAVLKELLVGCQARGQKTRAHYVKRRIKKLEEAA